MIIVGHVGRFRDRPTSENVILMLAAVICLASLLTPPAILAVDLLRPEKDVSKTIDSYVNLMNVLVGAVVGYVSARAAPIDQGDVTAIMQQTRQIDAAQADIDVAKSPAVEANPEIDDEMPERQGDL